MTQARAYFDYNATTPLLPQARQAMVDGAASQGNAASVHAEGRAARHALEGARKDIAALAGLERGQVIFTSGATEANNLALWGLLQASAEKGERMTRLFISAIEHDSVSTTAAALVERLPGLKVTVIPVSADGVLCLTSLKAHLREGKGRALIAVMLANNETGVVQPVAEVGALARAEGALLHVDAVQAPGRIPIAFTAWGVTTMALSSHKLGGPQGTGALLIAEGRALSPLMAGGGQEFGLRPGTQNVAGAIGFGAAAQGARAALDHAAAALARREVIEGRLLAIAPGAKIYGRGAARLCNTIAIGLPGVLAETQVMALDLDGVAVSAGSACSSGKVRASPVLTAMGANPQEAAEAIRISFGWATTQAHLDRLFAAYEKLARRAANRPAPQKVLSHG